MLTDFSGAPFKLRPSARCRNPEQSRGTQLRLGGDWSSSEWRVFVRNPRTSRFLGCPVQASLGRGFKQSKWVVRSPQPADW